MLILLGIVPLEIILSIDRGLAVRFSKKEKQIPEVPTILQFLIVVEDKPEL